MLPIEIYGRIGSYLFKQDHYNLSRVNRDIWHRLPLYSRRVIFTDLQEDLFEALINSTDNEIDIISFPHAGTLYVLATFCSWWIERKEAKVFIICRNQQIVKWKKLFERIDIKKDSIVIQKSCHEDRRWTSKDLIINMISRIYPPEAKIINWFSFDQANHSSFLLKKSIIPPSSYEQYIVRKPDLFSALDCVMKCHDYVTLIGGMKNRFDRIKKHAESHGKYTVIQGGKTLPSARKIVVVYEYASLNPSIELFGFVMVRCASSSIGVYKINRIYEHLLGSKHIEKVYWYTGCTRYYSSLRCSYNIFKGQIGLLLFMQYRFDAKLIEIKARLRKEPDYRTLSSYFHTVRDSILIQWNNREVLKKMWEEPNETIERMISGETRRY